MKKRILAAMLATVMVAAMAVGCGSSSATNCLLYTSDAADE